MGWTRIRKGITSTRIPSRASIAFLFIAFACLEPYSPPTMRDLRLLIVDGFLNSQTGLSRVKLSRSQPLDSNLPYPQEVGANVRIEGESTPGFQLSETSPGMYQAVRPDLQVGSRYRLLITTSDGQTYESDFVVLRQSPSLGDVFWTHDGDGITIRVDSQDPSGNTRYYQWIYEETWQYDADRAANWIIKGGRLHYRTPEERIDICYSTKSSSKVLISTTSDQSGDVINDFPLTYIPAGSRKLSRTYSILVQQRALDEQSYQYWSQLQRTNENLGGLFDPLPSQVTGNIHSTTTGGPVALGYFSGGGVEEKRIYIHFRDLPEPLRFVKRRSCMTDTLRSLSGYPDGSPLTHNMPPTMAFVSDPNLPWPICMDCRLDGGTTTRPSFWPF
jgi:hypothetical protein